ncbi:MAG: tripartite tricarboxylate transporter TctB family protein [Deltaproteobacteria bacterium]
MLSINRWVALGLLAFSSGYGYLAFTYRILPFERFLAMKPNTLPIGLAVAGMICSIALLLMPEGQDSASGEEKTVLGSDQKYLESPGDYEWGKGVALLVLAVVYALSLRQAGFLLSTSMFLIIGGIMLGERKYWILVPVSCFASFLVWYLVDEVLTIFMRPLPMIFYQ